jgi:hypothetical protein
MKIECNTVRTAVKNVLIGFQLPEFTFSELANSARNRMCRFLDCIRNWQSGDITISRSAMAGNQSLLLIFTGGMLVTNSGSVFVKGVNTNEFSA